MENMSHCDYTCLKSERIWYLWKFLRWACCEMTLFTTSSLSVQTIFGFTINGMQIFLYFIYTMVTIYKFLVTLFNRKLLSGSEHGSVWELGKIQIFSTAWNTTLHLSSFQTSTFSDFFFQPKARIKAFLCSTFIYSLYLELRLFKLHLVQQYFQ